MSERDEYSPGVPCWVDTWQADAATAAAFYADLLGWEPELTTAEGVEAQYVMCRMRGRDVAAIGSGAPGTSADDADASAPVAASPDTPAVASPDTPAAWTTYIQVASVDDTLAKARAAGGAIVTTPFDSLDGGRIAILADPARAIFGVWEPGAHRGAQVVNEPGAWAMSVLLCDEPESAKRFYAATFGWSGDPFPLGDTEATLWRLDGYVGGEPAQPVPRDVVGVMAPAFGRPAGWTVNFWVHDVDAAAARAPELGGTVLAGPLDTAISRDAVIADPGGAVFGVSTAPTAAP